MGRNYYQLFCHFVWRTKDSEPLLADEIRERVHGVVWKKCEELGCLPVAIGSVEDHIHLLVEMVPSISPSRLMKDVKAFSSLRYLEGAHYRPPFPMAILLRCLLHLQTNRPEDTRLRPQPTPTSFGG